MAELSSGATELSGSILKIKESMDEMGAKIVASETDLSKASKGLALGVSKLEEGLTDSDLMKLNQAIISLDEGLASLKDGSEKLKDATSQNRQGVQKLAKGLNTLDNKSADLKEGTIKLSGGLNEFEEKSKALGNLGNLREKALDPMSKGLADLNSGIGELRQGALKLKEGQDTYNAKYQEFDSGLRRYKTEGIDKISSKTGDLKEAKDILDIMADLAEENSSISGTSEEFETKSRIIEKIK